MIKGSGVIIRANNTLNATAKGSISGSKLSLTVAPVEIHDIYKLDLSLSSLDSGIYIADPANGTNRSGKVTFTVSSNIFKSSKDGEQWP